MTDSQQQATINFATRQSGRVAAKKANAVNEEEKLSNVILSKISQNQLPQAHLSSQPQNLAHAIAQTNQPPHQKRTKERTIQDIIEKVSLWRKLYNGVTDTEGNLLRYSLEDAASKVGVSKKSLDDYLL